MPKAVSVHLLLPMLLAFLSPAAAGESVRPSPVPSLTAAPAGTFPSAQLQDLLDKTVLRGIPGVVLGIATPQGAWLAASGVADISGGDAMTAFHALRIAQASETFTAALIWSLVEDRRLHPDDTVDTWLFPRSVPRSDVITVRMLLNHTSGLADHTESASYVEVMGRHPSHTWSAAEVLAIARTQPLKFVPGTGFAYSSTNDYLLGLIAEAVTRRPLERLVRDRLFSPAGMARSSLTPSGKLPHLSTPGYAWLDGRHEPSSTERWSFSGEWTAGGATSTAYDMLAWASRLAGGKVLRPRTLEEAWTVESPSMMAYGFEATRNTLGYRRFGRTGVKPGTTTDLLVYPDQGWALFIGFNVSDSRSAPTLSTRRIVREVREAAEQLLGWNSPPTYATTVARNRVALQEMLATLGIPSASVALVDGERIVWSETFGSIDEKGTKPGPDTMFCIGSVSKILAAVAVMKLVDQGKVDLDEPLVRYLPDFRMASPEYSRITVRMLLNHSAGFGGGDYRNMFSYAPLTGYSAQVQGGLATERLKHSPGYLSVYCNDCVTMVEPLVRAASGATSYTDFVEKQLLGPLGMANSRYSLEPFPPGSFAPGVLADTGTDPGKPTFDSQEFAQPYASGGLYTTPEDMSRLAAMLLSGGRHGGVRILSEQAVAEMGRDQTRDLVFNPVPTFARGLGWDNVTHSGLAAVGVRGWHKKGGTMVYETDYVVAPDEGIAVLATFSKRTLKAGLAAERILFDALAERGSIPTVPKALADHPQPERRPTDEALAAVAGTYANKNGPIRVEVREGAPRTLEISSYDLTGHTWDPFATALKLRDDGTFSSDGRPNESYRAILAGGRRYLLQNAPKWTGNYREEAPFAQYIPPAKPLGAVWKQRADREWLVVNEDARSWSLERNALPRFRLDASDDYPGYLFATSLFLYGQIVDPSDSDTVARMFLKIPMEMGRDLNDVVIEARNGEEWVRFGSSMYRPRDGVAALSPGVSTVTIGAEGYVEWRKVSAAGSVAIAGATAWKLYDKDLQRLESGWGDGLVEVAAPGSYLMLYGKAATPITLTTQGSGL